MKIYLLSIFLILLLSAPSWSQESEGIMLTETANHLYHELHYEESFRAYEKAYLKYQHLPALRGMSQSQFEMANQYQFNGDATTAQTYFSSALRYADLWVNDNKTNTEALLLRGLLYLYNQQFEKAKSEFEHVRLFDPENGRLYYYLWTLESEEGLAKINHPYVSKALTLDPELYELHQELGSYYSSIGMTQEAISAYERALEISPKNYKANFALGQVYWALGDLPKMRHHFSESLKYFPNFGYAKMSLAGVALMEGNITEAVPLIKAALKDNPMTKSYVDLYIQNFPDLANYHFREKSIANGAPIDAEGFPRYYQEAISLAQTFDFYAALDKLHQCYDAYTNYAGAQPNWKVSILAWMTHCYREVGSYAEAAQTAKESLNMAIQHQMTTDQASLAANLSFIYDTWGDLEEAVSYGLMSLNFLLKHHQEDKLYDAYTNLGSHYRKLGNMDSAIYYQKLALSKVNSGDLLKAALIKKELAVSYGHHDQINKAKELADEVIELKKNIQNEAEFPALDFAIAQVYYHAGEYQKAKQYIEQAADHFLELQEVSPGHPLIIPFVETYIGISVQMGDLPLAYNNLLAMNNLLFVLTKRFFPSMNESGKLLYYRLVKERFETFNSFVMHETNRPGWVFEQMFENQLLIKGLLFQNAQKVNRMLSSSQDPILKEQFELLVQKRNLFARSISLTPEEKTTQGLDVDQIQKQIDSLEVAFAQLGIAVSQNELYEEGLMEKVKAQLSPDEAAIEMIRYRPYDFADGGEFTDKVRYLALIMRGDRDSVEYVLLSDGSELESKHYQAYANAISFELQDPGSYDVFWKPIQDRLKGIKRVYFAGDGVYHKVNINTLYDTTQKKYVIDELDIRLVTSTRDILSNTSPWPRKGQVTLIGFPKFEMANTNSGINPDTRILQSRAFTNISYLSPLPGTFSEVNAIAKIFEDTKWNTNLWTAETALEENVKALGSPTILHIATHGFFEEPEQHENPLLYSGLFLSGATSNYRSPSIDGEDGILTAYEALNLDLGQTQMVVLSACETGVGRVENGEGVYGLQRAFLIAGAQSVIMSLWKVDDQTTMELMTDFYGQLTRIRDKHVAFRTAQLEIKKRYPSPKYWGAFNIAGK